MDSEAKKNPEFPPENEITSHFQHLLYTDTKKLCGKKKINSSTSPKMEPYLHLIQHQWRMPFKSQKLLSLDIPEIQDWATKEIKTFPLNSNRILSIT